MRCRKKKEEKDFKIEERIGCEKKTKKEQYLIPLTLVGCRQKTFSNILICVGGWVGSGGYCRLQGGGVNKV